jgi:hypothetical protein
MIYKFYIIKSDKGDKVYIGSTTNDLKKRWGHHKSDRNCNSCILFDEYGVDNCKIELISEIDFETKQEARREEGRLIREAGDNAVNEKIAGRSQKEWYIEYYEKNKVEISEYNKKRREENKEHFKAKYKQWYENNKEQYKEKINEYRTNNKEKISARRKIAYEKNKEIINVKRRIAYQKKKLTVETLQ